MFRALRAFPSPSTSNNQHSDFSIFSSIKIKMTEAMDNPDVPSNKKAFIPLGTPPNTRPYSSKLTPPENNPEVMSSLLHKLGLSTSLSFHDVFSIDEPSLLDFIPRPALALLLVFPVSKTYESFRYTEDKEREDYKGKGEGEPVIWYKQTIRNACGLIGLLHAVSNGAARGFVGTFNLIISISPF